MRGHTSIHRIFRVFQGLFIQIFIIAFLSAKAALAVEPTKKLRIAIDCNRLKNTNQCFPLLRVITDEIATVELVSRDRAQLTVDLWDEKAPNGFNVFAKWKSVHQSVPVADFQLPELNIPFQYDFAKQLHLLKNYFAQGLIPCLDIAKSESGAFNLVRDLNKNPGEDHLDPETIEDDPWYFQYSIYGSTGGNGLGAKDTDGKSIPSNSRLSFDTFFLANRSTESSRFFAILDLDGEKYSQPSAQGRVSASNYAQKAQVLYGISLDSKSKWNIAIQSQAERNPGSNLGQSFSGTGFFEYTLIPFRVEQNYEGRVAILVSQYLDELQSENSLNKKYLNYQTLGIRIFAYWQLLQNKASFTTTVKAEQVLIQERFQNAGVSTTFRINLSGRFTATMNASFNYTTRSIRFPKSPDFSNPLRTNFLTGYPGASFSLSTGLQISLSRGWKIYNRDRRFSY